jgi:hypothetical protein
MVRFPFPPFQLQAQQTDLNPLYSLATPVASGTWDALYSSTVLSRLLRNLPDSGFSPLARAAFDFSHAALRGHSLTGNSIWLMKSFVQAGSLARKTPGLLSKGRAIAAHLATALRLAANLTHLFAALLP